MTGIVLIYLIAACAIVTGITEIATALRLRKVITGEWILMLAGAVSVVAAILLIAFPGRGAIAVALWIGILLTALGFRLRSWGRSHGTAEAVRTA